METPDLFPISVLSIAFPIFINGNLILTIAQTFGVTSLSSACPTSLMSANAISFPCYYPSQATIFSCLDYYNSLLIIGLLLALFPITCPTTPNLLIYFNTTARVILLKIDSDYVAYLFKTLHWLFMSLTQSLP